MRTATTLALLGALVPTAFTNPILSPRVPIETATLTFFTTSSPVCSKSEASYSDIHYVFTSLDKCKDLKYTLGSPYHNVQVSEISPDFASLGWEVVLYEKKGCKGDVVGRKKLDGKVKEDTCYGIDLARSVLLTPAGDDKETGFDGTCSASPVSFCLGDKDGAALVEGS
jgi:hypothetical protein